MNWENIKKVRDHIAGLPEEQLDMRYPILVRGCGCIMAHGEEVLGYDAWVEATKQLSDEDRSLSSEYSKLVMPPEWQVQGRYSRDDAVRVLDHLLRTGKVDWEAAKATSPSASIGGE